jgi:cephalosporin hydroxylase
MTTKDDRQEFEAHKEEMCLALGRDQDVFIQARDTILALDKYSYPYLWSWMGVPIIQLPADIMATQEVVWKTKPDVIIETGVARGGSMIFMASLLAAMGNEKAKVIGVDIDIRPHNRESIESHPLSKWVTMIEGGSVDEDVLAKVKAEIPEGARVMVILDSDHTYQHVLTECRAYGPLVTKGCYMVVADTSVGYLPDGFVLPNRARPWAKGDEPLAALKTYLQENSQFEVDPVLNGKLVLSSSPNGYCRRKSAA